MKDVRLELRQKYALQGIALYLFAAIFVCYLVFQVKRVSLSPPVWNALFWIILLFNSINSVSKSFATEPEGRYLYYLQLAPPSAIILSKIAYNALLLMGLSLLAYPVFSLVLGNPVEDQGLYMLNLMLTSACFAGTLTLVSSIAARSGSNSTLMAILSFPTVLPLLLVSIKVSQAAIDGLDRSVSFDEIGVLIALNVLVVALSYLLFPYIWRHN
jgi:heme exporter protein B